MQIGLQSSGSTTSIKYGTQPQQRVKGAPQHLACDTVHTSRQALMLSRNMGVLREKMEPRPETIEKFAATMDAPLNLEDGIIDGILQKMSDQA